MISKFIRHLSPWIFPSAQSYVCCSALLLSHIIILSTTFLGILSLRGFMCRSTSFLAHFCLFIRLQRHSFYLTFFAPTLFLFLYLPSLKIQTNSSVFLIVLFFSRNILKNNCRIQTHIVRIEGKHADYQIDTTAQMIVFHYYISFDYHCFHLQTHQPPTSVYFYFSLAPCSVQSGARAAHLFH